VASTVIGWFVIDVATGGQLGAGGDGDSHELMLKLSKMATPFGEVPVGNIFTVPEFVVVIPVATCRIIPLC
jgi:hypothetical protein